MKSQTSLVAQQTRLNQWAEQIRECNNRPQGMTVDDWCLENGITRANYYWRLRKVREALLTVAETTSNTTFVELKEPEVAPIPIKQEEDSCIPPSINNHCYHFDFSLLLFCSFVFLQWVLGIL